MHLTRIPSDTVFQALADETRLRIIHLLVETGEESCLCELVDSLLEPSYKLSRHLKILRQAGLLTSQKEGRWVYHRMLEEPSYITRLYDVVRALPDADGVYAADLTRFHERLCLRDGGRCLVGIQREEFRAEAVD
ncbi:MAG TPA: metalloregulator ArsR/SmtB family transcription factor [Gammaproteobacteria bacterium]|nr:metalloregulator ArsR/SmtB family transcription factor [Gammaproteobacteria bacterium]